MITWYEVPHNILEIRDRYEALSERAVAVRTVEALHARGEYDPDEHAALNAEALTAEEWAELLAYGHALARYYAHQGDLGRAVRAGMTWQQVAEAIGPETGGGAAAARAAYREWAAGQRQLNAHEPGIGMTAEQYAEALALADDEGDPGAADDARAAAVRELEAAGADRRAADARTRAAVLAARAAGVPVRRTAELAGISPDTVQRWTQAAAQGKTGPARAPRAVSEAVAEAIGTQLRPVLSRQISEVPEITWTLLTDDASDWVVDGLGPVRVSAQIAGHDYGAIREFIEEIARTFGGTRIRDVTPPFPDREVRNVEVTVSIGGVPVTVWGSTASAIGEA